MHIPHPPFSQKLLVIAIYSTLGIGMISAANAQSVISTDGTTGTAGAVNFFTPGVQNIVIDGVANGTQNGSNLFFSFSQFGIAAGDTVLFQCPSCVGVTNVISRVTGLTNPSTLAGPLTSTIGSANFWFFNPIGVTVNAAINVPVSASYHISNADQVVFSNGQTFGLATNPAASTLTTASPVTFGFNDVIGNVTGGTGGTGALGGNNTLIVAGNRTQNIITGTNIAPTPTPPISGSGDTVSRPPKQPPPPTIPEQALSTLVRPIVTIDLPQLPQKLGPCGSDDKSSLITRNVANYIPEAGSQVHSSVLGTGATSLTSVQQSTPLSSDESDECL